MKPIILPDVELNIYNKNHPVEAKIVENRIVSKESSPNYVRHITFDVSGTELEGRVCVGQSVGVMPPGEDEKGRPHKMRLYSVSSPSGGENGNPALISTTVKRTIEEYEGAIYLGVASNYLADRKPGDTVMLAGPSGKRFLLPEDKAAYNYLFFATGTGIAPFRGMMLDLIRSNLAGQAAVLFGCSYRTDLLYADLFGGLDEQHENVHYLTAVSREDRRADGSKKYVQTLLEDRRDLLQPILEQENTLIYICGLKGMETGIYRMLLELGLPGYLEWRKDAPEPEELGDVLASLSDSDLKKRIRTTERVFEEVY